MNHTLEKILAAGASVIILGAQAGEYPRGYAAAQSRQEAAFDSEAIGRVAHKMDQILEDSGIYLRQYHIVTRDKQEFWAIMMYDAKVSPDIAPEKLPPHIFEEGDRVHVRFNGASTIEKYRYWTDSRGRKHPWMIISSYEKLPN